MKPIRVGLVADPAAPTEIARRMGDLDPPSGEDRDAWDIEVVSEPFTDRLRGRRHRGGAAGRPGSPARLGPRRRPDRASASRRRRPVPAGRDRPAATDGGAVAARARRAPDARAHPARSAHARQRHGRPHLRGRAPRAASPPRRPLAAAPGHGARQPSVAARARTQVRARRGTGNRSRRHDQLHGLAAGRLVVVVAPRGRDDRLGRARRRLARDRRRAVGPPGRRLRRRLGRGRVSTTPRRW